MFKFTLSVKREVRRRMYPVLKRLADQRSGAFLVLAGKSPLLFYATDRWIGKLDFEEGGEGEEPFTRLEARLRQPWGRLEIRNQRILEKLIPKADRQIVPRPEGILGRKFVVSSPEPESCRRFLDATVVAAVTRLSQLGNLLVHIDRDLVRVEVGKDLGDRKQEPTDEQCVRAAGHLREAKAMYELGIGEIERAVRKMGAGR